MLSSRSVGKQTVTGFKICQNPSLIKSLFMKRKLVDVFCGVGKLKEMQREPIYCTGLVPWIAAHAQRQRIKEYILTFLSAREELTMWMQSLENALLVHRTQIIRCVKLRSILYHLQGSDFYKAYLKKGRGQQSSEGYPLGIALFLGGKKKQEFVHGLYCLWERHPKSWRPKDVGSKSYQSSFNPE